MKVRSGKWWKLLLLGISAISIPCLVVSCTTNQPAPVKQQPPASPQIWINLNIPFNYYNNGWGGIYWSMALAFNHPPITLECLNKEVKLNKYKGTWYMTVKLSRLNPGKSKIAKYYMNVFTYNLKTNNYVLPFLLNGTKVELNWYSQVLFSGSLTSAKQDDYPTTINFTGIIYITNPNP